MGGLEQVNYASDQYAFNLGFCDGKRWIYDPVKDLILWNVPAHREAVRAGPGRKLVIADYSQIELRLIAFMTQEPTWINAILEGKDLHIVMTSLVYEIPYDELYRVIKVDVNDTRHNLWAELRAGIKSVNFGIPYGAGENRVAQMIQKKDKNGNPVESDADARIRAKKLIQNYFAAAPNIEVWLAEQRRSAQQDGFTRSVDGRRRFYEKPDVNDPNYTQLMSQIGRFSGNQPIQSTSADMLKKAIRNLYLRHRGGLWTGPKIIDSNLLLVCHDEAVTDAAEKDVPLAKDMLELSMTEAYDSISSSFVVNGQMKTLYLRDLASPKELKSGRKVSAIVADFWAKD